MPKAGVIGNQFIEMIKTARIVRIRTGVSGFRGESRDVDVVLKQTG